MTKEIHTIMRCLAADTEAERESARAQIREMMANAATPPQDAESMICEALLDLGVPDRLLGHSYLVYALRAAINDPGYFKRAVKVLYPDVAKVFDTSPTRAERAIRHAIEVCWSRMDCDAMVAYFGNTVSPDRGKPTNTEFIARVANMVRKRMKEAS